jgi:hypothetical protein
LFHNTLSEIVSRIERKFVIRNNPDGFQEVRLLINPEPTPPTTPEKGDRP